MKTAGTLVIGRLGLVSLGDELTLYRADRGSVTVQTRHQSETRNGVVLDRQDLDDLAVLLDHALQIHVDRSPRHPLVRMLPERALRLATDVWYQLPGRPPPLVDVSIPHDAFYEFAREHGARSSYPPFVRLFDGLVEISLDRRPGR